ncbi:hypothetical protein SAMN04488063_2737 [Halopelagius inordinatus]|uniref:Uncharacterized protein n=1 Tax=Halopelagius inordinatus TaxID=553467 RepID=A0A1I2U1D2_9EURY|nr:hypothetical protein [Halopelagius inordinatus]SFG70952.1 hypothetical protein SAMN04488063_2737 [Halopelagius inordinatus]
MPDENRFARLGDAIGESNEGESEEENGAESSEREPSEPTAEAKSESDDREDGEAASEAETEETGGGPAFEFEATTAKSVYVRPETVDVLDDAEFEVESFLRREHDVRDVTGREFHDALVRVAAEYPDEVADAILAARDDKE